MTTAGMFDGANNDGEEPISFEQPYNATVKVEGVTRFLFHRYRVEAAALKAQSAPGSRSRKADDPEEFVYRTAGGRLCIPTEYFRQSVIEAAQFIPSPRSSRGSARPLFKMGVFAANEAADLGVKTWDVLDARRAIVNSAAIARVRPALEPGWRATFVLRVELPNYISPHDLLYAATSAGRLVGLGDYRPTFGRFAVVNFEWGFRDIK